MATSETVTYYHSYRQKLIDSLGGQCTECGGEFDLEFHHVDLNGESHGIGGWQQYYKVKKEIANGVPIVLLCKPCHVGLHANGGK